MHRLFAIAVLGAAAILPPHLGAQFRGAASRGMVASGFHGGFHTVAPGFHGGFGGFRTVPVAPFGFHGGFHTVAPFGVARFPTRGFVFVGSFGHNPHFHVFVGTPCVNCGFVHRGYAFYGYPGYAYPPYYPMDYSQQAYAQQPPVIVQTAPPNNSENDQLVAEVQGLRDEVRQMREDQNSGRQPAAARSNQSSEGPAVVLVFRDGHRTEINNYAIAGQTLWVFNERQAKKILISELDVPATEAANAQRGVEFSLPQ